MRFAAEQHPLVPPATLLRMITANAAKALGRDDEIGTLTPGKFADLAIMKLPRRDAVDPHELLFDPGLLHHRDHLPRRRGKRPIGIRRPRLCRGAAHRWMPGLANRPPAEPGASGRHLNVARHESITIGSW